MFSSVSPLQDRRGAARALELNVQPEFSRDPTMGTSLPPLKSPRGYLLERIRSTPRSSKFVPQSGKDTTGSLSQSTVQQAPRVTTTPAVATTPHRVNNNIYTPQRNAYQQQQHTPPQNAVSHDAARLDQLAILEEQLRSQNNLLAQQQMLLQKLQYQQQTTACPTPPYTPESRGTPAQNSIVYDPSTGQYYMYAPQYSAQPQFNYTVTPAQASKRDMSTPGSLPRSDRSITPPKEGTPSRQPKGPPAIESLVSDASGAINFAGRSRQATKPSLDASTIRRRSSPLAEHSRSLSRASQRSTGSLGPIEEAFPAMTI